MFWNTDILHEMNRLRREMNNLFSSYPGSSTNTTYPLLNVFDSTDNITVIAELPGMTKDHVNITYVDNVITIRGKLDPCEEGQTMTIIRQERSKGSFEKTIRLPTKIVAEKIEASFDNGILTVTLPKAEDSKPKTITINAK